MSFRLQKDSSRSSLHHGKWEESVSEWKQTLYKFGEKSGGIHLLQHLGEKSGQRLYVLAYHRVDAFSHRPWLNPELISATPDQFREQMTLLKNYYHPVTAEDVLNAANGGRSLPKSSVLVTVDDGYLDFKETILPICRELSIRPVLFVPTGYISSQEMFWWDKLYQIIFRSNWKEIETLQGDKLLLSNQEAKNEALQLLTREIKGPAMKSALGRLDTLYERYLKDCPTPIERSTLDWDDLREVSRQGCDVAAHTCSHPIMSRITAGQMQEEIRLSLEQIRSELGSVLPIFAYPDGVDQSIGSIAVQAARENGVRLAFTMIPGQADLQHGNKEYLPRLGVWSRLNLGHYHLRLTPAFSRLVAMRKG
jgi:peptidoglycan/xylan/chitin deacetylase (PgdA/CDA1 family)